VEVWTARSGVPSELRQWPGCDHQVAVVPLRGHHHPFVFCSGCTVHSARFGSSCTSDARGGVATAGKSTTSSDLPLTAHRSAPLSLAHVDLCCEKQATHGMCYAYADIVAKLRTEKWSITSCKRMHTQSDDAACAGKRASSNICSCYYVDK
jgi:hypothetical protein